MKIVALDVATKTGICVGDSGAEPRAWSVNLGEPPDDRRFSQALQLTQSLIAEHSPDLIVAEAAIGGPKASAYLIGLIACVRGCAWNRGVRFELAHLSAVRKHFVGKALTTKHYPHLTQAAAKRAIKVEVMRRCHLVGWKPDTDDEADAMATWDWACATFAKGYHAKPQGGLFA